MYFVCSGVCSRVYVHSFMYIHVCRVRFVCSVMRTCSARRFVHVEVSPCFAKQLDMSDVFLNLERRERHIRFEPFPTYRHRAQN